MPTTNPRQVDSPHGIVATQFEDATKAGVRMLEEGGNAVDAAVAAALAICVVGANLVGIAGYGGSMMIYLASSGQTLAVDFDGMAPAAANEHMYSIDYRRRWGGGLSEAEYHVSVAGNANTEGPLSVSVPGVIAGLGKAQQKYGKRAWKDVVAPAIRLARDGFAATGSLTSSLAKTTRRRPQYKELKDLWAPKGALPKAGEFIRNPKIAETLRIIAEEGPEVLYSGRLGQQIAQYVRGQGGILTKEDMAAYQARIQRPLSIRYRGYEILTPALPHGGLTVLQMLKILEHFDLSRLSPVHPEYLRLFTEAARAAWTDRLACFGDPEFVHLDQQKYVSEQYTGAQADKIRRMEKAERTLDMDPRSLTCTAHVSVVDREHNLVSLTETHGGSFGALTTVPEIGVTLSHGMSRFDPKPGHPNSPGPRKRMLNNMAPLIILKNGKPLCSMGAPGGRTIINTDVHMVVALLDFKLSIGDVMLAPRFHTLDSSPVCLGSQYPKESVEAMRKWGYRVNPMPPPGGNAQGVVIHPDGSHSGANASECEGLPMAER